MSISVTIIIFVEFIDQLIDCPINCASLNWVYSRETVLLNLVQLPITNIRGEFNKVVELGV